MSTRVLLKHAKQLGKPRSMLLRGNKGLAEYLQISVRTVQTLRSSYRLPCYAELNHQVIYFYIPDVLIWLKQFHKDHTHQQTQS